MATFRVGVGSFNIQDGAVGFGTDTDGLGNLKVKGVTKTTDIKVSGASTLTRYSGFAADNINQLENITLTSEVGTIGDIVVGVGTSVIISSASTVTVGTVESVSIGTHFSPPVGGIEDRGEDFVEGMMRFNTDLNTMEFYNGHEWRQFTYIADIKNSPGGRGRCVWAGGYDKNGVPSSTTKSIDFINSHTLGNSRSFGDLTAAGQDAHGSGNAQRGLFQGHFNSDAIEYITIASEGNSLDFGNMTDSRYYTASASSSTRSVTMGGHTPGSSTNSMEYVEITSLGNAIDFGDMSAARLTDGSAFSSPIEAFVCGGHPAANETYEVIRIASTGSSVAGDKMSSGNQWPGAGCSNSTRGLWAGGANSSNNYSRDMKFITMASKGNTQFFGDLSNTSQGGGGAGSNATRGVIAFGMSTDGNYNDLNILEYITFSTSGNSQDFGDLRGGGNKVHTRHISPVSDSHGGIGGF